MTTQYGIKFTNDPFVTVDRDEDGFHWYLYHTRAEAETIVAANPETRELYSREVSEPIQIPTCPTLPTTPGSVLKSMDTYYGHGRFLVLTWTGKYGKDRWIGSGESYLPAAVPSNYTVFFDAGAK